MKSGFMNRSGAGARSLLGSLGELIAEALAKKTAAVAVEAKTTPRVRPPERPAPPPRASAHAAKPAAERSCALGAPAAQARGMRPRVPAVASPKPLSVKATAVPPDPEEALRKRLDSLGEAFAYRERGVAAKVVVDDRDRMEVARRLTKGRCRLGRDAGHPVDIVFGVDFGTTSTKIAARFPYEGAGAAHAMPTPVFARPEPHPHLWATRLWMTEDRRLSLWPEPGAEPHCALKTRLMQPPADPGAARDAEAAAAAFLGLVIRHARGWLAETMAKTLGRGTLRWSFQFGFPAESLDDETLVNRYRRVCHAALRLADGPEVLTLDTSRASLDSTSETGDVALIPEIAAAVTAFIKGAPRSDGLYALVDIGGGTVDCCAFNLYEPQGDQLRLPVFGKRVGILGVEAYRLCETDPALGAVFLKRLQRLMTTAIWVPENGTPAELSRQGRLPIFLVGGGSASAPHRGVVAGLKAWLVRCLGTPGADVSLIEAQDLRGLVHEAGPVGAGRLCVAAGLSVPLVEGPDVVIRPPSVLQSPPRDNSAAFVSKDQC